MAEIDGILRYMTERGASDLHIKAGAPPAIRLHGRLVTISEMPPLTPEQTHMLAVGMMDDLVKRTSRIRLTGWAGSGSTCSTNVAASG